MEKMTFEESLIYIKSLDVYGSVLGLDNMRALAKELDNPEAGLKFIHVTGTNGKGSICSFLSSILIDAGYKVGTYNSPAVLSDIDQFRINMDIISEELYAEAATLVKTACDKVKELTGHHPTRFEVETMIAFVAFYIEKCDIVILETGLGGRDDATNIIDNTILHVFASISLDHIGILGSTRSEIASVKAGIIKSSAPVICYGGKSDECCDDEVLDVIKARCSEWDSECYPVYDKYISDVRMQNNSLLFSLNSLNLSDICINMTGAYQPANCMIAIKAANILSDIGYTITEENIRNGVRNAFIPFRFQKMKAYNRETGIRVDIILDGAHNPDGAEKLIKSLELNYPNRKIVYITGIFKDKDYEKIAEITGNKAISVYVIENTYNERSLSKNELTEVMLRYNKDVKCVETLEESLDQAINFRYTEDEPVIVCFGSLSWLKYATRYIEKNYSEEV